jgi:hypothetical protein
VQQPLPPVRVLAVGQLGEQVGQGLELGLELGLGQEVLGRRRMAQTRVVVASRSNLDGVGASQPNPDVVGAVPTVWKVEQQLLGLVLLSLVVALLLPQRRRCALLRSRLHVWLELRHGVDRSLAALAFDRQLQLRRLLQRPQSLRSADSFRLHLARPKTVASQ